jgi:NAD(P)-dependent dehydrogenase (short-subunit alcohol dehydrogenase family)
VTEYAAEYAIVTGGSRGIGLAICRRLKQDGSGVIILDRVAPEESGLGEFRAVDLSDIDETSAALDWALALGPVGRLVNNVGVVMPALLEDTSLEDFDALMALNVRCAIQCTQAVAPAMRRRGMGRIVNIASRAALGKALRTNYSASKAALIGLTRTWSLELAADGITVNCICPGPIATELYNIANPPDDPRTIASLAAIPAGRIGTPEDIAQAAAFFLHEDSGFINGQTLYVCGASSVGRSGV